MYASLVHPVGYIHSDTWMYACGNKKVLVLDVKWLIEQLDMKGKPKDYLEWGQMFLEFKNKTFREKKQAHLKKSIYLLLTFVYL